MERIPLQWIMEIPPVTRSLAIGIIGASILQSVNYISKSDCYYSYENVFKKGQYFRLITSLLYTGELNWDLFINLYVLVRNSSSLEQSFLNSRDYLWLIGIIYILLIIYSSFIFNLKLFSSPLKLTLVYIWSKRNPNIEISIMGILNFKLVYLPFVMIIFSQLTSFGIAGMDYSKELKSELSGIIIGHILIFFYDIYPRVNKMSVNYLAPIWDISKLKLDIKDKNDEIDLINLKLDKIKSYKLNLLNKENEKNEKNSSIESNSHIIDSSTTTVPTGSSKYFEESNISKRNIQPASPSLSSTLESES
ncbi:hypothetical protein B5S33_g2293 [[Candida] boidinii]|nr:hypothetical protein B5S33_g2293 [[Candida] boidinii]GMG14380.1 unnamed protein product [[Candida] boidinii]